MELLRMTPRMVLFLSLFQSDYSGILLLIGVQNGLQWCHHWWPFSTPLATRYTLNDDVQLKGHYWPLIVDMSMLGKYRYGSIADATITILPKYCRRDAITMSVHTRVRVLAVGEYRRYYPTVSTNMWCQQSMCRWHILSWQISKGHDMTLTCVSNATGCIRTHGVTTWLHQQRQTLWHCNLWYAV